MEKDFLVKFKIFQNPYNLSEKDNNFMIDLCNKKFTHEILKDAIK